MLPLTFSIMLTHTLEECERDKDREQNTAKMDKI